MNEKSKQMEVWTRLMWQIVLAAVIAFVVAAVLFFVLGIQYRRKVAEKEISSAEEEAKRIINESIKSAESKKREALVEAKEEILQKLRSAAATCRSRSGACSRRKRIWTARPRTSRRRRTPCSAS